MYSYMSEVYISEGTDLCMYIFKWATEITNSTHLQNTLRIIHSECGGFLFISPEKGQPP